MKKLKDTDYLYSTARVRALEQTLLNQRQIDRMLETESDDEATKVLAECGYSDISATSVRHIEEALSNERNRVYTMLLEFVPNRNLINIFRTKYDYHNLKVLIKADARGTDASGLLINSGRIDTTQLTNMIRKEDYSKATDTMRDAIKEAQSVLALTSDPQLSDLILDRACFDEMTALATGQGDFLINYVRLLTDAANIKTAVRSFRLSKESDFLSRAFLSGGNVSPEDMMSVTSGVTLEKLFKNHPLEQAAAAGDLLAVHDTGFTLTDLDRMCDDAIGAYLNGAKRVPFGDAPIIAYLAAKETEYTHIRTIMSGRIAGIPTDYIRERLGVS